MIGPATLTAHHTVHDDHPVARFGQGILGEPNLTLVHSPITNRYYLAVWVDRPSLTVKPLPFSGKSPHSFGPAVWRDVLKMDHPSNWAEIKRSGQEASLQTKRKLQAKADASADRKARFTSWNNRMIDRRGKDYRGTIVETRFI